MAFCRVCCLVSGFYFEPVLLKPWKKTALSAWVGEFVVKSLDEVGTSNETTKWPLEGSEARWCAWCKAARKTETSLSWKRKIWSWVGKGFLSTLIRKVCNIGMAKSLGKMQCLRHLWGWFYTPAVTKTNTCLYVYVGIPIYSPYHVHNRTMESQPWETSREEKSKQQTWCDLGSSFLTASILITLKWASQLTQPVLASGDSTPSLLT